MNSAESGSAAAGDLARALREGVSAQGVTLVWLRDRLAERGNPVSLTTLSYWRSGRRRPEGAQSRAAVADIEMLLELDPGDLTGLMGPARRRAPRSRAVLPEYDEELRRAVEETFDELDSAPMESIHDLTTHVVVDVDEHGEQRRRTLRCLVQATAGVLTELPYIEVANDEAPEGPAFTAVAGCRTGRSHSHPGRRVFGVVLELDQQPVAPGTTVLEFRIDWPPGAQADQECSHGVTRPNRETLIWVRFHPARLPTRCERYIKEGGREDVEPLELHGGHMIHAVARGFGPGEFGLRWEF